MLCIEYYCIQLIKEIILLNFFSFSLTLCMCICKFIYRNTEFGDNKNLHIKFNVLPTRGGNIRLSEEYRYIDSKQ